MSLNITLLQLLNSFSHFSLLLFQHLLNFPFHIPIHLTFLGYFSCSGISNSSSKGTYRFRWWQSCFDHLFLPDLSSYDIKQVVILFSQIAEFGIWINSSPILVEITWITVYTLLYKQWHSFGSDILDILNISLLEKLFNVLFYIVFKWIEYVK